MYLPRRLPESLFALGEIAREIGEQSILIRAEAALTRATSQRLCAEARAAREARQSQRDAGSDQDHLP